MLMNNWKTTAEHILAAGPVVPVIVVNEIEHAVPLAKALGLTDKLLEAAIAGSIPLIPGITGMQSQFI
ncbi:hypothetical protein [Xenorhabdus sp. Sc-CR9]|uniref:hypothetical protein n=1 Tax=Xenorhabdus sp. Sc-CR9 TaxID=2584468 RepID=UPI001F20AC69|nr:hypothetical protein [Xenorhabdus sp. Sc-CR9]